MRQALSEQGLLRRDGLAGRGVRSLRRQGLVVVQPGVVAAATQPLGVEASMHAGGLSLEPPYAFLGLTALWLHGVLPLPDVVEVGVPSDRGLTVHAPVVGRRVASGLLDQAVVRGGWPAVRLEVTVVQAAAQLAGPPAPGRGRAALQQLTDRRRDRWVLLEHGISTPRVTAGDVRHDLPRLVRELLPLFCSAP